MAHPRDVLRVGDEVDVKVLDVVPAEGRKPARVSLFFLFSDCLPI